MKFQIQLVAAILGMFLVSTPSMLKAASADDDDDPETDNPVEMIARVSEVQKLLARYDNPCLPPVPPKPSTILAKDDGDHGDFWNLEPNKSEFDLRRLGSRRFSIGRVTPEIDEEIEEPVFLGVNLKKDWITVPPCTGTSLKKRKFLFALQEIEEPGHSSSKSWHALFYVPMEISEKNRQFFLFVLSIENDHLKCEEDSAYGNENEKKRCRALRRLAVMKMDNESLREIRKEIRDKIDLILPKDGFADDAREERDKKLKEQEKKIKDGDIPSLLYHNGVIHGSLF
jgi:hypothetical protein